MLKLLFLNKHLLIWEVAVPGSQPEEFTSMAESDLCADSNSPLSN